MMDMGVSHVDGRLGRSTPVWIILASLALPASAGDDIAQTVFKWGLIGPWSRDCPLPPDHDKGAVLTYAIAPDGNVVLRRDFGDSEDESKVISAKVSNDGMLNLRVYFAPLRQTREYGLMMQPNGTMRAIYNRNEKNQYTIKNGKFTADGKPTPPQHKCEKPAS
jgi:hypothetical protein